MHKKQKPYYPFVEITNILSISEFEKIKKSALNSDYRFFFRSMDNNNPAINYGNFQVFFGADDFKNINNNPNLSDFNELTIKDNSSDITYYNILIVRKGDVVAQKEGIMKGMEEGKIYLIDFYKEGIYKMRANLPQYLETMKKSLTKNKKH
ncbi:hypothetical protein ACWGOQ_0016525 [Aquimarina sp. M1]